MAKKKQPTPPRTQTYEQTGIPEDELPDQIKIAKADPRYVSHEVIEDDDGTFTLRVTIRA